MRNPEKRNNLELGTLKILTEQQKKQFFNNLIRFELQVRSVSLLAEGIPCRITGDPRINKFGIDWYIGVSRVVLADQPIPSDRGRYAAIGDTEESDLVPARQVGEQAVHANVVVQFIRGSTNPVRYLCYSKSRGSPVLYEATQEISAKTEVVATEPSGYFQIVTDSKLENAMRRCFLVDRIECVPYSGQYALCATFQKNTLPVAAVFDVIFSAEGKQYQAGGTYVAQSGPALYGQGFMADCDRADLKKVDIVLIPNPERARRTIDLTEIWGKPIRIEKVPVVYRGVALSQPASRNVSR